MPTALLKNIAKEKRIPLSKVEQYWQKAKKIAEDSGKSGEDYYPYVVGILKRMTSKSRSNIIHINLHDFMNNDFGQRK